MLELSFTMDSKLQCLLCFISFFVAVVVFFSSREGFQSVEESSQRNKKLIGKKLNNSFLVPLKPFM